MKRALMFSRDLNDKPRQSEVVKSAGYDLTTRILEIEFQRTGAVYQYSDVPPLVWGRFLSSHSKGGYVSAVLNQYTHKQVG